MFFIYLFISCLLAAPSSGHYWFLPKMCQRADGVNMAVVAVVVSRGDCHFAGSWKNTTFALQWKKKMQHKDIVAELARRLERGEADVEALADGFASLLKEHCGALETVAVPGFGKFEGEKLMERVEVDSASGRRMLYPPEIRMTFVPGTRLKTRIAEKGEAGDE